jgi:hypothetical protein
VGAVGILEMFPSEDNSIENLVEMFIPAQGFRQKKILGYGVDPIFLFLGVCVPPLKRFLHLKTLK